MSLEFTRQSIDAGGVRFSYLERVPDREPSRPPLLLLHGLIATAETLAVSLIALPEDCRIVALDILTMEGDGGGDGLERTFSMLAQCIVSFAAEIGCDRPVLLGHSHGGALALQIAVMRPEVPSGLILLCPAHPFGGYSRSLVRFYGTPAGSMFARLLPLIPARWFNVSRLAGPDSIISRAQVERYRAALRLRTTVPRVLRLLKSWEADMCWLGRALHDTPVAAPTLLLWGDCDPAVPAASAAALEHFLSCSDRIMLQGIGHLPADEAPEVCAGAIRQWLGCREL